MARAQAIDDLCQTAAMINPPILIIPSVAVYARRIVRVINLATRRYNRDTLQIVLLLPASDIFDRATDSSKITGVIRAFSRPIFHS